jgi:hypothetical protein
MCWVKKLVEYWNILTIPWLEKFNNTYWILEYIAEYHIITKFLKREGYGCVSILHDILNLVTFSSYHHDVAARITLSQDGTKYCPDRLHFAISAIDLFREYWCGRIGQVGKHYHTRLAFIYCCMKLYYTCDRKSACIFSSVWEIIHGVLESILYLLTTFFLIALQPQFGPWPTSMKLSVSLQFSRS